MAISSNDGEHNGEFEELLDVDDDANFDDPPGFEDNITDEELLGDILAHKPKLDESVDTIIIVDGIPIVKEDRLVKLKSVLRKVFSKVGQVVSEHYVMTDEGETAGYAFLEFADRKQAQLAIQVLDGHKLDRQHTLIINDFADYDAYINAKDSDVVFQPQEYVDNGNLRDWLLNPDAYDQYCIVDGSVDSTRVVMMLNSRPEPQTLHVRKRWSEKHVVWSPLGTYLTTFHREGVLLWGGKDMKRIHRFTAPDVVQVDFSPAEKYMVTLTIRSPGIMRRSQPDMDGITGSVVISVWDVNTELAKRSFNPELPLGQATPSRDLIRVDESAPLIWPAFKWAFDDRYLARMAAGSDGQPVISVYETPSFGLLDKKSIKVSGLRDFTWSPTDHIIAYYVAENKDVPARVVLISLPNRNELRVKNLFNVADCHMLWQRNTGDYLCLKVDRYSKMRKTSPTDVQYAGIYYNLEVFYMRAKQIPVDSAEIKDSGIIVAIAWEPQQGSRVAIIHGSDVPNPPDYLVTIFEAGPASSASISSTAIVKRWSQRRKANVLAWSPGGQMLVLAGLDYVDENISFIDTSDYTTVAKVDHYMVNEVKWDPTGRYLISATVGKPESVYWIWSSHGRLLNRIRVDFLRQLTWRPRPPTLLSKRQIRELRQSKSTVMKKYTTEFEALDQVRSLRASQQIIDRRRTQLKEWTLNSEKFAKILRAEETDRSTLRDSIDEEEDSERSSELEEEVVQFLVQVQTIVL